MDSGWFPCLCPRTYSGDRSSFGQSKYSVIFGDSPDVVSMDSLSFQGTSPMALKQTALLRPMICRLPSSTKFVGRYRIDFPGYSGVFILTSFAHHDLPGTDPSPGPPVSSVTNRFSLSADAFPVFWVASCLRKAQIPPHQIYPYERLFCCSCIPLFLLLFFPSIF